MTDKTRSEMLQMLDLMLDESKPYPKRLEAYEYLSEDCEEIVDVMLSKLYTLEGDSAKMLMEVLSEYKGNKAIFMGLVGFLYRGEDVALFARLIGRYGDEQGIEVLKTFCEEYEPNYNEFMELRNAIEELGGDFTLKQDFSDDPLYRYLKGLDDADEQVRATAPETDEECDDCDDDCHDDDCDDCNDDCCHHDHTHDSHCDHTHDHRDHDHHCDEN